MKSNSPCKIHLDDSNTGVSNSKCIKSLHLSAILSIDLSSTVKPEHANEEIRQLKEIAPRNRNRKLFLNYHTNTVKGPCNKCAALAWQAAQAYQVLESAEQDLRISPTLEFKKPCLTSAILKEPVHWVARAVPMDSRCCATCQC